MEQQFPCGPKSSCCGPIGQSEEEVKSLKNAIEVLGLEVEIYDVQKMKNLQENPQVFKLFRTFGPQAIPVITVEEDVACMGQAKTEEVISAIKSKLGRHKSAALDYTD
ncbi:MAG: arsenic metallochaperone ArsD family protein [Candidatus Omnitrophota bacterium]|nr:arsenic metallochaperone ArsD family protein [Candidatus Omnitrophota bacterium]